MTPSRLLLGFGMALAGCSWPAAVTAQPADGAAKPAAGPEAIELFERQVRPVLVQHCQKCHGEKKQEAGLRLDSRKALVKGSENGPVVAAGNPAAGKLLSAVNYANKDLQMPPDGKLPAEAIEALTHWIQLGLPWPAESAGPSAVHNPLAWKAHWAFQPVREQPLPAVRGADWFRSPLDAFILAKLEPAGLAPAPPAARAALLRRAMFDVIGLPPTAAGDRRVCRRPGP